MTMPNELREFQLSLGRYLRSPKTEQLPQGINARRAKVYEDLLFRNISGFINNCFPVCKSLIEETEWLDLIRVFFKEWRATSPQFKDIPEEFLTYLKQSPLIEKLPPWFYELAHYEWVELYLDTAPTPTSSIETGKVSLKEPCLILNYQWPVQHICHEYIPNEAHPSHLAVYRNAQNQVQFLETSLATNMLLESLQAEPMTLDKLYENLAKSFGRENDKNFQSFCLEAVTQLSEQGLVSLR